MYDKGKQAEEKENYNMEAISVVATVNTLKRLTNINELFTIQNTISVVLLLCTILLVIKLLNTKSEHAKDKEQAIADKTNLEAANQLINSLNAKTQNLEDQISSLQESRTKLIADKNQWKI